MNVEEYISSGILEAYVQGELSAAERADVERNLATYPELRSELTSIEEVQEALLQRAAVKPRDFVKALLLAKVDAATPEQAAPPAAKPEARVVAFPDQSAALGRWRFAAAASVALAVVSSYMAYDYWGKWKKTEGNLANLIAQSQQMAQDYNKVNYQIDQIENDLKVLNNPDFQRVVMKGTPNAPAALASVYWNQATKEVFLSIGEMKALSADQQYQLWAIIDGKPVDAGVFDSGPEGLLKMKNIGTGATTFAVTIEPKGGKESPSLETMQVAGNVVKG